MLPNNIVALTQSFFAVTVVIPTAIIIIVTFDLTSTTSSTIHASKRPTVQAVSDQPRIALTMRAVSSPGVDGPRVWSSDYSVRNTFLAICPIYAVSLLLFLLAPAHHHPSIPLSL